MSNLYFTDKELRYSAYAKCNCGAGLAYPTSPSQEQINLWEPDGVFAMWSYWDCSDILTGRADKEAKTMHTGKLPFAFYEIKSENQPSADGATTRKI